MSVDRMHMIDGNLPTESLDCIVMDPRTAIAMVTRVRICERERRNAFELWLESTGTSIDDLMYSDSIPEEWDDLAYGNGESALYRKKIRKVPIIDLVAYIKDLLK